MTENVDTSLDCTPPSSIRQSRRADLKAIRTWLTEEEAQGVHGNFLCNWSTIECAHRDGELLVYLDGRTGLPLGFQLGGLIRPGIIQVHYAHRGKGIGRKMVERCVALATKRDEHLLYIECKPSTSSPFWQRMGFTLIENDNGKHYAYRIIDKPLKLPEQGNPTVVVIRFYPEERIWKPGARPYATFSPRAKLTPDGSVFIAQRVQFHREAFLSVNDVVVEIEVNGSCRFCDKAKYEKAHRIGVERCENGFYIDTVRPL